MGKGQHMPPAHQAYAEWTPERLVRWAQQSGPATAQLVTAILASRAHPLQGFRSCLGIMRLGSTSGDDRLEAACARALALQAYSYKSGGVPSPPWPRSATTDARPRQSAVYSPFQPSWSPLLPLEKGTPEVTSSHA